MACVGMTRSSQVRGKDLLPKIQEKVLSSAVSRIKATINIQCGSFFQGFFVSSALTEKLFCLKCKKQSPWILNGKFLTRILV